MTKICEQEILIGRRIVYDGLDVGILLQFIVSFVNEET